MRYLHRSEAGCSGPGSGSPRVNPFRNDRGKSISHPGFVRRARSLSTGKRVVSELLTRVEGLENAVERLGLNAVLTALGGVLEIPTLPGALPSFSCPN
jgi:hypothetical protein